MIPQRTLSGECEITTGAFSITKRPPVYTGESAALNVQVAFKFQGVDYTLPSGVVAEMYLRYPNTDLMTVAVEMEKSGNTASGVLSAEQTGVAGYPLLVIQLTDIETSALIVACATAVKVSDVRGDLVIDSRAPSPSEIIYVGRSPYVDPITKHWMQWDANLAEYVDTEIYSEGKAPYINANTGCWMIWDTVTEAYVDSGIVARGLPATFTARATTLPAGSDATASITGTAENPVLNVGVPKGQDSAVLSVNGQTGAVQVNDEDIPSNIDGKANVEAVLSYHSQQIADEASRLNSNQTETTDVLALAIACTKTTFFKMSASSAYTGDLPSNAYKGSTGIINVRGGGRFVTITNPNGGIATNYYDGTSWSGWKFGDITPINVLTSNSTTAALSAAQGKALLNIINNLNDGFTYVSINSITLDMDSDKVYFVFAGGGSGGMSDQTYGFMAILIGKRTIGILHNGPAVTYNYTRDTFTLTASTTLNMGVIVIGKVNQK